ncbi:bifunctional serine/threonine-protein kinase/ABC transporter substrate-binding protein [Nocardia sp. NPDC052001]|uniref:bifunctional serine/threonine-protein kinase/ABC transporter substrate-binding protein n=1 Tax=Nocardia sp. NPDC052001 TaxID=3154853 RepID=UPI00342D2314
MRAGEIFAGYQVERLLGSGGMGSVYLARHPRLPRMVALKVLSPEFAGDAEIRARFEREAELIARLDHPNIVSVSDRGVENGRLWIAMQFIDGSDAAALLPPELPPPHAIRIVGETAKALDYAHTVGVLHRDVKPANIMLARPTLGHEERVLLTDFGIGRLRDDTAHLTRTGTLTATLAYASPEQLSGMPLDQRSDQYSLACSLYWLLSGATPFQSGTAAAVVAGHLHFQPPPISSRRGGLPAELDAVFGRALAKNPAERFDTCRDFAAAATRALTGVPPTMVSAPRYETTAPPTIIATNPHTPPPVAPPDLNETLIASHGGPPTDPPSTAPWFGSPTFPPVPVASPSVPVTSPPRRGRWITIGAVAVVVLLAVSFGILWATRDSKSDDKGAANSSAGAAVPAGGGEMTITPGGGIQPLMRVDADGNPAAAVDTPLDPAGDGTATCPPTSIAMAGALTGPNAALGRNVLGGVRLAVEQFTRKNPGCAITVKEFDTTGNPQTAAQLAPKITADPSIAALIGPVFSGETKATGAVLSAAGLPFLSPSATNSQLSQNGWRTFFRGLADDDFTGLTMGRYLAGTAGHHGVCVVWDTSDYGVSLGKSVTTGLGSAADTNCSFALDPHGDFNAAVSKIATAGPDAIFYAGYYTESATLLPLLHAAGITLPFYSGDGSNDPSFVDRAGSAASGATLSCPCAPAPTDFATAYRTSTGTPPGVYSAEAYDLTAIVLHGIASGHTTHPALLTYLTEYSGEGIAQTYGWTSTGDPSNPRLWLYRVG